MTPQQRYYRKNKEKLLKEGRDRYYQNIDNEKNRATVYYENNKETLKEKRKLRARIQRVQNPSFKLKSNISRMIRETLRRNNSSKNNRTFSNYIGYSILELKQHLEKQFEPWMGWQNWGVYYPKKWDDNNSQTWVWQLDHIIPQSKLSYTSMMDDNFKKCWALNNLRPLSAKQNFIKGNK